ERKGQAVRENTEGQRDKEIIRHCGIGGVIFWPHGQNITPCKDIAISFQNLFPASGRSTIAHAVEMALFNASIRTYVLDGDDVRHGINGDLGFSREERGENLRRIVELSKLFVDAGILVLAAFLSPYKTERDYVKKQFEKDNFLEIYVKCSRRYPAILGEPFRRADNKVEWIKKVAF
ncbi:MAG: adenylyl-sulfate kinase, partial [Thermodesulfovibrionales bacterium]|nr:adenylyl-sulfate kinase [Thermodesulfovibrionales bacterium]